MIARSALFDVLCIVLTVYWILFLARVIVSWAFLFGFRPPLSGPTRKLLDLLEDVTEPVLRPLRSLVPPVRAGGMGIDLSMIIAFVIILVVRQAIGC